jgi:predicted Zn-dependent peptidase
MVLTKKKDKVKKTRKLKVKRTVKKTGKVKKSSKKIKTRVYNTLNNGLKLYIRDTNKDNNICILFLVKTGGINEGKYYGISHLLEHILLSGTRTYETSSLFNKELESYGTKVNGFTTKECTAYHFTCYPSKIFKCISILSEVIKDSILDSYKIENEKKIVLNETFIREDKLHILYFKKSKQHLFKNTIYEELVIGDKKSLDLITKSTLHAYLVSQYKSNNCIVSVSGKLDKNLDKIKKELHKEFNAKSLIKNYEYDKEHFDYKKYKKELDYFDRINKVNKNIKLNLKNGYFKSNSKKIYIELFFKLDKNHILNEKMTTEKEILKFIDDYLTSGMNSGLFDNLREKNHLIYTIKSSIQDYNDFRLYNIYYSVLPNLNDVEKSLKIILDILNELSENDFSMHTTRDVQIKRKYRTLIKTSNNTTHCINESENLIYYDLHSKNFKKYYNKKIDILKINPKKIKEVCKKTFDKKNRCITIFSPITISSNIKKLID